MLSLIWLLSGTDGSYIEFPKIMYLDKNFNDEQSLSCKHLSMLFIHVRYNQVRYTTES